MKTKTCTQCGEKKSICEFYKNKSAKDGLGVYCKSCIKAYEEANKERIKAYRKAYREANKEKIAERDKAYQEANKDKIKAYRQANKEKIAKQNKAYYEANKEKLLKRHKAYSKTNKEKIAERQRAYRKANKEKIVEYRKAYYQDNKEKVNTRRRAYRKYKYNNDPLFKIKSIYRNSVKEAFTSIGKKKNCNSIKVLGLEAWQELEEYLSNQFYDHPVTGEKMTFDNHGKGENCWQIDHIVPLLTAKTEEDVIRLSHYTNLQPLWEVDHLKKTYSDLKNR